MINTVVARRYANAIFALGAKEGDDALNRHGKCLAGIEGMIAENASLDMTLKSPVVSIEEKKAVVAKLLDSLDADKTVRNFCFLLAEKERLGFLREIAVFYGKLLDEKRGVIRGKVTTAIPLSNERQAEIRASLQQKSGSDIELQFDVDEAILGGRVLHMGDRVLDSSLRAQLGILRKTFKRGE